MSNKEYKCIDCGTWWHKSYKTDILRRCPACNGTIEHRPNY